MQKTKRNVLIIGITILLLTPLSLINAQTTISPTVPTVDDIKSSPINTNNNQHTYISTKISNEIEGSGLNSRSEFTYLINETATTVYGHEDGTSTNIFYNTSLSAMQLNATQTQGSYISQLFDVNRIAQWKTISWESNAMGELADNEQQENRFVTGNVNMSNNVLLMHMNEQEGQILDSSGKGNHGTGSGVTYNVTGQLGTAIGFDGVNDRVTLGVNATAPDFNGVDGITIAVWINPASLAPGTSRNNIVDLIVDADKSALMLTLRNTGRIWFGGRSRPADSFVSTETDTAVVQVGTWQHIVGVLDFPNDKITIYYNGQKVKEGTATFGSNIFVSGAPTAIDIIGCNPPLSNWYNGAMDEFSIWGRRLSEEEARDVYQRGLLNLNFSIRGSDQEDWVDIDDDSPQNLTIPDSQFIQYKADFTTTNMLFTPALYNITIHYEDDGVSPTVTVLYPNGGEILTGSIPISWSAVDDKTVDLNGTILIEYSADNGVSWTVIASGGDNTGVFVWDTMVVPDGDLYLIRVSATDEALNTGFDVSDAPFSIDNIDSAAPEVSVIYPNGGELVYGNISILWSAVDDKTVDLNGTILIEYSADNGVSWTVIASGGDNTGVFVWDTMVVPDGDLYLIRVSATDEALNTGFDVSDAPFSIDKTPPQVSVIYPNGGELVYGNVSILWSASDIVTKDLNGTILIEYSADNGVSWTVIASGGDNTGVFVWDTMVVPDGDLYLIRVSATDEALYTGSDVSDAPFSVNNHINFPPGNMQIHGPSAGGNGIPFTFTATATDPEGEAIYYKWDWNDGNVTDWKGPFNSSTNMTITYSWANDGDYNIRIKAKDVNGSESDWSAVHYISIEEQINFSNVQLGHIYFKLFSFNRSFIFSDFLKRLSVVIILTSHPMELEGRATGIVKSVTFKAENQMQIEDMEITDDDGSDGFNCIMNVTRGVYVLNISAYDENGSLVDQYSLFTVFFIRIGRYATGPGPTYLQNLRTRTANLRLRH